MYQHYTDHNYLKYGYNNRPFTRREWLYDQFFVKIGFPARSNTLDFKQSCIIAASLIASRSSKELVVCMSGGIDSEMVARFLMAAEMNFSAAIMVLNDGLNQHDIQYAYDFCNANNIGYEEYHVDVNKFFKEEKTFIKESQAYYAIQVLQNWLISEIARKGQFPIPGNGDLLLTRSVPADFATIRYDYNGNRLDDWYVYFSEDAFFSGTRFMQAYNIEGVNSFFSYLPEQMHTFLSHPDLETYLLDDKNFHLKSDIKQKIYSECFPDLQPRPKYRGNEYIKNLAELDSLVQEINPYMNQRYRFKYMDLRALLNPPSEGSGEPLHIRLAKP